MHLRTFECESPAAGRAQLLQLLAEIQGPLVERSNEVGDVAFAAPGNTFIAAARGHYVFVITNGGQEVMDLAGVAGRVAGRVDGELGI